MFRGDGIMVIGVSVRGFTNIPGNIARDFVFPRFRDCCYDATIIKEGASNVEFAFKIFKRKELVVVVQEITYF